MPFGIEIRCRRCNQLMYSGVCQHCDSIPYEKQGWKRPFFEKEPANKTPLDDGNKENSSDSGTVS